jgi:soluble lytic murein transglycosylase
MLFRLIIATALLTTLAIPASALNLASLPDEGLIAAAKELRAKNFVKAATLAANAPVGGVRDFIFGIATYRQGRYDEAQSSFSRATTTLPLLADYALYYQAQSQIRLNRPAEAIAVLGALLQNYPDTPLYRQTLLQRGNLLFERQEYRDALASYQRFTEKYAAGNDSIQALYRIARCREELGELAQAVTILRSIWLNNPAAPQASQAEEDLKRLATKGAATPQATSQELFKRAITLMELKKYDQAVKAFRAITPEDASADFADRLKLKIGQALMRGRKYSDAEKLLTELAEGEVRREVTIEARYQLARTIEKRSRDNDAFAAYLKFAADFSANDQADDALLSAAFIRKFQGRHAEAVTVLKQLLASFPKTPLLQRVRWEIAWNSFRAGDLQTALDNLKKLVDNSAYRERALFWTGRILTARGERSAAQEAYTLLARDFPFGYYALTAGLTPAYPEPLSLREKELRDLLPLPDGYERVKLLISFGLNEEAQRELALTKKRTNGKKGLQAIARLYLEMDNYRDAMLLFKQERPDQLNREHQIQWGLSYPRAFTPVVTDVSRNTGIAQSLVYGVMRSESNFSPTALSPVGARGLMQLMPTTAAALAKSQGDFTPDRLSDPQTNITLGVRHLKGLIDLYQGNTTLAVAAYNAGTTAVNRWRTAFGDLPQDEFIESIPYSETREYVKKVLAAANLYQLLYETKPAPKQVVINSSTQAVTRGGTE